MTEQESPGKPPETDGEEARAEEQDKSPKEYGGPKGKEPTRYGDWEKKGRCIDF